MITTRERRKPEPRGTLPIRLRSDERERIEMAAEESGEYLTSYIRRVALLAARRDLAQGPAFKAAGSAELAR